jgi:hypothetical protein
MSQYFILQGTIRSLTIKLRKIGKRDLHIILKVLPNKIIKKYIAVSL